MKAECNRGVRLTPGLFHFKNARPAIAASKDEALTANSRNSRDHAESLFSKTQTQAMALNRLASEQDEASSAREAKTARLKELRLEKEASDIAAAAKLKNKVTR